MYDNQPELFDDMLIVWHAFEELTLARHWRTDGEPLGLEHSEIAEWLNLNLIRDDVHRNELYRFIKAMDISWLAIRRKKRSISSGKPTSSDRRPKRKRRL